MKPTFNEEKFCTCNMALIDCFEHCYFHLKFTGHLLRCRHGSVLYKRRAKAVFFALTDELVAFSSDLCAARMEGTIPASRCQRHFYSQGVTVSQLCCREKRFKKCDTLSSVGRGEQLQ